MDLQKRLINAALQGDLEGVKRAVRDGADPAESLK